MDGRILVLYTGGTIGMVPSAGGYVPGADFASGLCDRLAAHGAGQLPAFDVQTLPDPIDSANLQPSDWARIGQALVSAWEDYDGFVVLHGTDTLAWTASALSFMLRGCDKPVICTGAQIPWQSPRSDAPANFESALGLAACPELREVVVCFGRHGLRGNRSQKVAAAAFDAFASPRIAPLADIGIELKVHVDRILPRQSREFRVPGFDPAAVSVLTVHPGLSARLVEAHLADSGVRAVLLRSYGAGTLPTASPGLVAALAGAVEQGIVVVNTTQCATGGVAQGTYASSAILDDIGVVSGRDMTLEAAYAKLHLLLASGADPTRVGDLFGTPWCGECF